MSARRSQAAVSAAKALRPPPGKHVMPALEGTPNALESALLGGLDPDRLNQLAESLFTLNKRRFGPIPGAYVVVCIEPERRWCVGQLSADRARPLTLFEAMQFDSPKAAQLAAASLRRERGEPVPKRSI